MKGKSIVWLVIGILVVDCSKNPTLRNDVRKNLLSQGKSGTAAYYRGEYELADGFFQDALRLSYKLYIPEEMVRFYAYRAEVALSLTNLTNAESFLQEGERIASVEKIVSFDIVLARARYWHVLGDEKAVDGYMQALRLAKKSAEKIQVRISLASFWMEKGNYVEARKVLDGAGVSLWFLSDYDILGMYFYYSGMVALKEGRLSDALRLFQRALDYDRKAENTMGIVKDMLQIAEVYRQQGDTAMQRYYEQLVEQALDKNEIPR